MTASSKRDLRIKSQREARNFIRLQRDLAEKRLVWQSRPRQLEYSFNSACNLRCLMCHQSENPPVIKSKPGQGEALLEWFSEYGTLWTPSATSEPLANDLDKILSICSREHLFLEIITNGMLLTPQVLERILPRLQRLTLSIDSHDKEVLERIRARAVFEVLVEHASHALRRCAELAIPANVHCVLMRDNARQLGPFVDWCADLGAREITLLAMLDNTGDARDLNAWTSLGEREVARGLEAMKERARARKVNLFIEAPEPYGGRFQAESTIARLHTATILEMLHEASGQEYRGFCPMASNYLKINPDGEAFPCCRACPGLELGNVFEEGFEAIWNGPRMQALRQRMFTGDLPEPCVGCSVIEAPRWGVTFVE